MTKKIALFALVGIAVASTAYGSGFRIPEQSINSVALSGAYIANANGPDSSYFNPANMSWAEDAWQIEADLTYINLSHINYTDNRSPVLDGSSETENFILPQFHAVSKDYNNFRFGISLTYPFGLAKRWDEPFPAASSKKFSLRVIETSPSVSYKFSPKISFAAGVRILKADGDVKSHAVNPPIGAIAPLTDLSRDMDGDAVELGYNLALTVKPIDKWAIGATYRSRVDLAIDGSATLAAQINPGPGIVGFYDGDAGVNVITPAVLSLGTSYSFEKTTVEFVWDRTYWSRYTHLDFNYAYPLTGPLAAFDRRIAKDWDDTDAFRIGITHKCTDKLTTMIGFGIDDNPVPSRTLNFELPDSDAKLYSIGFRYQKTDNLQLGMAYLYDDKDSRKVTNSTIDGEFEDATAHLFTMGFIYTY